MGSKYRVAVVGYGNIGKYAVQAIQAAPDMELAGVVRRPTSTNTAATPELADIRVVHDIDELEAVDAAIMATPTRNTPAYAKAILAKGISTVDSYDIHGELVNVRNELATIAKGNNAVAVIAAGWDPGTDSIVRCLFEMQAPRGITYTNFGPGMSMGHSTAVKAIAGVKNALSLTIPKGTGLHRRAVYVELEDGVDFETVKNTILNDPYFVNDETHVFQVPDVEQLIDTGHGVIIERKGVSGVTPNQLFTYEMRANNPALTSQIMVASVRAAMRQQPGAYTMVEIPLIDYLYGERDELLKRLV